MDAPRVKAWMARRKTQSASAAETDTLLSTAPPGISANRFIQAIQRPLPVWNLSQSQRQMLEIFASSRQLDADQITILADSFGVRREAIEEWARQWNSTHASGSASSAQDAHIGAQRGVENPAQRLPTPADSVEFPSPQPIPNASLPSEHLGISTPPISPQRAAADQSSVLAQPSSVGQPSTLSTINSSI